MSEVDTPKRNAQGTYLRLPKEVMDRVKQVAMMENRSVSNLLATVIIKWVEGKQPKQMRGS